MKSGNIIIINSYGKLNISIPVGSPIITKIPDKSFYPKYIATGCSVVIDYPSRDASIDINGNISIAVRANPYSGFVGLLIICIN